MKIILVRHGKPKMPPASFIKASEFGQWIRAYDMSVLDEQQGIPEALCSLMSDCQTVVCSDLPRSIASAQLLGQQVRQQDAVFREAELPYFCLSVIRLPVDVWLVLFRLLWLFGFSKHGESYRESKIRAYQAAQLLQQLAIRHGSVVLVGHGVMNRLIRKALIHDGWQCSAITGKAYWSYMELVQSR